MPTMTHWRSHIPDLVSRAQAVSHSKADPISARSAACCLCGVMNLVAERFGVELMQRSCADLTRCDAAWETKLGTLPRGVDGVVPESISMVARGARGILPLAGAANLRAALSFWASESDPAGWARVMPE